MNTLLQYLHYRWNWGVSAIIPVLGIAAVVWLVPESAPAGVFIGLLIAQFTALGLQIGVMVQNWRGKL